MVSFDAGTHRFHLRAGAVVADGPRVLLHQLEGDGFWSLPGGRVAPGETAAQAVVREMREELGEAVHGERLIGVLENFFDYRGRAHHEVGLYFQVQLPAGSRLLQSAGPFEGIEQHTRLIFAWFDRAALPVLDLRPACLCETLTALLDGKASTPWHRVQGAA